MILQSLSGFEKEHYMHSERYAHSEKERQERALRTFRALRAVFLDKQPSYEALMDKSDLGTLQNRRLQDIANLMYKVKHKLCPTKICERFYKHCSPYNLRVMEFAIPRFRTEKYGKHSFTYLGPKLCNKLPSKIRTLPSLLSFKNRIRKFDLRQDFLNFEHCAAKKTIIIFCRRSNLVGITCVSCQGMTLVATLIILTHIKCCSLCSFLTFLGRIWSILW